MRKINVIAGLFVAHTVLLLPACTSLETYRLTSDATPIPPGSFPYALVKVGLTEIFTITLTGCKAVPDPTHPDKTVPGIQLNVSAALTQAYGPDSSERYYVDYKKLQSVFKTTTLKISTNNDQTLQSVSAEVNDQTMQVVGAALQTAAQISGAVMLNDIPVANVPAITNAPQFTPNALVKAPQGCSDATKTLLTNLDAATANLTTLSAAQNPSAAQLTAATNAVSKASQPLTMVVPITILPKLVGDFPDATTVDHTYPVPLLNFILQKWLISGSTLAGVLASYNGGVPVPAADGVSINLAVQRWSRDLTPTSVTASGNTPAPAATDDTAPVKIDGIVVRQPALGTLRVCIGKKCSEKSEYGNIMADANGVSLDLAPITNVAVPQLGKKLILPLHNSIGTDVTIGATLATDGTGSINTLSFGSSTNAVQGLGAIGAAAGAVSTAISNRNTAIAASNTANAAVTTANLAAATLADNVLKAQADCYTQQATIIKAGGKPVVNCENSQP